MQDLEKSDLDDYKTKHPLFDNAVRQLGSLKENEFFGFKPTLFLSGSLTLDNLNKLDIQTH